MDETAPRLVSTRKDAVRRRGAVLVAAIRLVARSSPSLLSIVLLLQVCTALSGLAQVALVATLVRAIVEVQSEPGHVPGLLVGLAALTAVSAAAGATSPRVQRLLGEVVARSAWSDVLSAASRAPLSSFDSPNFSDRLARVREHAVARPLQVVTAVSSLATGSVGMAGLMVYLATVHWVLPLLVMLAGIPAFLGSTVLSRNEYRFAHETTALYRLRLYVAGLLSIRETSKELRAYGFGGWLRERHDSLYTQFLGRFAGHVRRQAALQALAAVCSSILASGALLILILLVDRRLVDVGSAAGAALALRMLSSRVQELVSGSGQVHESALFLEDLFELEHGEQPSSGSTSKPSGRKPGPLQVLEMRGVDFTYPGAPRAAVKGVSFQVRPGRVVALVGENGSGKTSVAKVVSHLYTPGAGEVLWNGVAFRAPADVEAVQRRMAVLFQDYGRYAFTADENVYLGDVRAHGDEARRDEAADRSGARHVIDRLSDGWETLLAADYGGQDISLGQWQRIALARVHFRHADLVILDEPTAALDPRAEARLFADVRRVLADKAVLLITHRLASARTADDILVMQHGEVVERGDHHQLMARRGVYAELWDLQAAGYSVDGTDEALSS